MTLTLETHSRYSSQTQLRNGQPQIAIRLYENQKYGGTYAPSKYYTAMFNATADILNPCVKYLMDYVPMSQISNSLRTEPQFEAYDFMQGQVRSGELDEQKTLVSWVKRLDGKHSKPLIEGFSYYDFLNQEVVLCVIDRDHDVEHSWRLDVHPCKIFNNKNSPSLFAANYDLN